MESTQPPTPESARPLLVPAAYVLLLRNDEVLLQLRSNTGYMDGHWAAAAAGHVEIGESVFEAAVREAREELGVLLDTNALSPVCAMHRTGRNRTAVSERVDFFLSCEVWQGDPEIGESHKTADLQWFSLDALPSNVVPHERVVLEGLRTGVLPPIVEHGF